MGKVLVISRNENLGEIYVSELKEKGVETFKNSGVETFEIINEIMPRCIVLVEDLFFVNLELLSQIRALSPNFWVLFCFIPQLGTDKEEDVICDADCLIEKGVGNLQEIIVAVQDAIKIEREPPCICL